MSAKAVEAYDLPERVKSYDADMEIMHPRRSKMVDILLEVVPHDRTAGVDVLDLGTGTGYLTARLLEVFPRARVVALDAAPAILELARARLGDAPNVTFVEGDFRRLGDVLPEGSKLDMIVTSYALHHLDAEAKRAVFKQCAALLVDGGWLVNADLVVAASPVVERRIQEIRVDGVVRRAAGSDERFRDHATVRAFLDRLEANEGDQPLHLAEDLDLLQSAGFREGAVYWQEYREVVYAGVIRAD